MGKITGALFSKSAGAFPLQDVDGPNLLREQFPYSDVPYITFDTQTVEMNPPKRIWITDTTFRDGQQAREPFTVDQIVEIYKLLHKLNGTSNIIRQCEFFLYSEKDKEAVEKCIELDYRYPEVTGWIRALKKDFALVKAMGLKETGILTSCSDYHIFLKLKKTRRECMEDYLDIVRTALEEGIKPRCHFEDVTRADIYGFVVPFAIELMKLREEYSIPVKIRLCDTMGFGLPFPEATLPRSVPKLVHAMVEDAGVPSELLEWHGHNDFHRVEVNSIASWLYGCSAVNCALLGLGERTGNCPLEGAVIDYIGLVGGSDGIDTKAITEIADYLKTQVNVKIPDNMPLVGAGFNVTSAGVHVDGILKDEEIYNIFDTKTILDRPIGVVITDKSGVAGVAHWINTFLNLEPRSQLSKSHPGVHAIHDWITSQFAEGRVSAISNAEMLKLAKMHIPEYFEVDFNQLKHAVISMCDVLILHLAKEPDMIRMNAARQELLMGEAAKQHSFINLMLVVNTRGEPHTRYINGHGPFSEAEVAVLDKDYRERMWFRKPLETGSIFVSDLFTSKISNLLCITASAPIRSEEGEDKGVLRVDVRLEDIIKTIRSAESN